MGYINSYVFSEDWRFKWLVQDCCINEYNQRICNVFEGFIDFFCMVCYKIIGCCDVNNCSLDGFLGDVNDWVWFQFNFVWEIDRLQEFVGEFYGFVEFQFSIWEIGFKYFFKIFVEDIIGSFVMFFYFQILLGMFENVIVYFYFFSYVDVVYFFIVFFYYGFFCVVDVQFFGNDLFFYNICNQFQINFGCMFGYYICDFCVVNVVVVVDYFVFICLNVDEIVVGQ